MVRSTHGAANVTQAHYPDLRSTVYRGWAPPEALEGLPGLYHSCLAVPEYFTCRAPGEPYDVCVLEEPEAIICYRVRGMTAHVLNRVFDIEPEAATRACRSLFRAHQAVLRVRVEVKFRPDELRLPHRVTLQGEDYVVSLPDAPSDYDASLGKTTRAHLRQYRNGLRRHFSEIRFEDLVGADVGRDVVDLIVRWNVERMRQKGDVSTFERHPEEVTQLTAQVAGSGEAKLLRLDGQPVAGTLSQRVGHDVWIRACAFDPAFARFHVGMLTLHETIRSYAGSAHKAHLMWGSPTHKLRLGAVRVPSWELSIYRSATARAFALLEASRLKLKQLWHCRRLASARWHIANACRDPRACWSKLLARSDQTRTPDETEVGRA